MTTRTALFILCAGLGLTCTPGTLGGNGETGADARGDGDGGGDEPTPGDSLGDPLAGDIQAANIVVTQKALMDIDTSVGTIDSVSVTALKGEYESMSLAVACPEACSSFSVSATPLTAGGSATIPSTEVDIRRLEQDTIRGGDVDWFLRPLTPRAISSSASLPLWLTFHVPRQTSAGTYTGELVLSSGSGERRLPVSLTVVDHELEDPPDVNFALLNLKITVDAKSGQLQGDSGLVSLVNDEYAGSLLELFRDMRAHGMTSFVQKTTDYGSIGPDESYWDGDVSGLIGAVRLAVEAGMTGPVIWYMSALVNGTKCGPDFPSLDGSCRHWDENRELAKLSGGDGATDLVPESATSNPTVNIIDQVNAAALADEGNGIQWPEVYYYTVDEAGVHTESQATNDLRNHIVKVTLQAVADAGAKGAATVTEQLDNKHNNVCVTSEPGDWYDGYSLDDTDFSPMALWCEPYYAASGDECTAYPDDYLRWFWVTHVRPNTHIRIYGYGYPQIPDACTYSCSSCDPAAIETFCNANSCDFTELACTDASCACDPSDINSYTLAGPLDTSICGEALDAQARQGHEIWYYENRAVMSDDRYLARRYFGYWGWKVRANGLTAWTHPQGRTVQLEIIREGIDDLKYLRLIERLIAEGSAGATVKAAAQAFVDDVSDSITLDAHGYLTDWTAGMPVDAFRAQALAIIGQL